MMYKIDTYFLDKKYYIPWIRYTRQHNFLPGLSSCRSEQNKQCLAKCLEIVITMDIGAFLHCNFAKNLEKDLGKNI